MISPSELVAADAIHIDTIALSHAYRLTDLPLPAELSQQGFEISFKNRENSGDITTARFAPFGRQSHEPRLTVIRSEHGYCGIKVETSIAKLLDGNGLAPQTNEDIACALDAIEDCVRHRTGVDFDSRTAKVKRLDTNADFQVGENRIRPYIKSLSCRNSRMTRGTVGTTTAQYYNGSRTLIAYGKLAEMMSQYKARAATREDVQSATGLLRIESRLRSAPLIRLAGKLEVTPDSGNLLTLEVAQQIVAEALTELGLDSPKPSSQQREQLLLERFGKDAPTMLGVLEWRARNGEDFWKELEWSQAKYYRLRRQLRNANLWDFSPTDSLPALTINCNAYNNTTSLSHLRIQQDSGVRAAA